MAIAHVEDGTALFETGATTHEVATTSSPTEGNILRMYAYINNDETLTNSETGWNKIAEVQSDLAGDNTIATWWKRATASEPATYTVSHSVAATFRGIVIEYSGVDETTPMDTTSTTVQDNNDSDTLDPADITTATDQAWVDVFMGGVQLTGTPSTPSGYTAREVTSSGGNRFGIWDIGPLSIGTESPGQISGMGSGADVSCITSAMRPAGASSGGVGRIINGGLIGNGLIR